MTEMTLHDSAALRRGVIPLRRGSGTSARPRAPHRRWSFAACPAAISPIRFRSPPFKREYEQLNKHLAINRLLLQPARRHKDLLTLMPKKQKTSNSKTIRALVDTSDEDEAPPTQPFINIIIDDDGPAASEALPIESETVQPTADANLASAVPEASQPPQIDVSAMQSDLLIVNHSHETLSLALANATPATPTQAQAASIDSAQSAASTQGSGLANASNLQPALPPLQTAQPIIAIGQASQPPLSAPRFSQPPKVLKRLIVGSESSAGADPSPDDAAPERTWQGPREVADSDSEGEDPDANLFGLSKPQKDKVVVLHPALVEHMSSMVRGRRKALKRGMSPAQVELLQSDFLQALDFWEPSWVVQSNTLWQTLEASRYAEVNPVFGRADVDLACKLLVPLDVAEDSEVLARTVWSVRILQHTEGSEVLNTRFSMVPCKSPKEKRVPLTITMGRGGGSSWTRGERQSPKAYE
jgi:hypothetical protein